MSTTLPQQRIWRPSAVAREIHAISGHEQRWHADCNSLAQGPIFAGGKAPTPGLQPRQSGWGCNCSSCSLPYRLQYLQRRALA